MEKEKHKRKAKRLKRLLICSYILYNIISTVYSVRHQWLYDENPAAKFGDIHLVGLAAGLLYFIPLISRCYHHSKLADMEKTAMIMRWVLILFIIWEAMGLVSAFVELVLPILFT